MDQPYDTNCIPEHISCRNELAREFFLSWYLATCSCHRSRCVLRESSPPSALLALFSLPLLFCSSSVFHLPLSPQAFFRTFDGAPAPRHWRAWWYVGPVLRHNVGVPLGGGRPALLRGRDPQVVWRARTPPWACFHGEVTGRRLAAGPRFWQGGELAPRC